LLFFLFEVLLRAFLWFTAAADDILAPKLTHFDSSGIVFILLLEMAPALPIFPGDIWRELVALCGRQMVSKYGEIARAYI
jgi:hypothetical protein